MGKAQDVGLGNVTSIMKRRVYPLRFAVPHSSRVHVKIKILKKFSKIPNTGYLRVWLQRITLTFDKDYQFDDEALCGIVRLGEGSIWNSEWLKPEFQNLINSAKLVDISKRDAVPQVIQAEEVELFISSFTSSL